MSIEPQDAVDRILGIFKAAWDPRTAVYDDLPANVPTSEVAWARASVQHASGGPSSLADATGTRKFTSVGIVTIQVFSPVGDGSTGSRAAATQVLAAFQSAKDPDVWFRGHLMKEVGTDGAFYQTNVTATFSYDTSR